MLATYIKKIIVRFGRDKKKFFPELMLDNNLLNIISNIGILIKYAKILNKKTSLKNKHTNLFFVQPTIFKTEIVFSFSSKINIYNDEKFKLVIIKIDITIIISKILKLINFSFLLYDIVSSPNKSLVIFDN